MRLLYRFIFFYTFFFLITHFLIGQDRCGTEAYNTPKNQAEYIQRMQKFEQWMDKKIKNRSQLRTKEDVIYQIPVVVHVIHNGEAVGEGSNIPFNQIADQIRILNEDFRRDNPDSINTPEMFQPVAADVGVEFVLARQDPNGLPTNGVQRVAGTKSSWTLSDGSAMKSLSYWPAEDYFNIWVAPLADDLLGYAEFPIADLEGLEGTPNRRLQDGIVVDYQYFGSEGNIASGSLGRTTTHEAGHYLGLLHIWGDGGCDVDDFCEDTPQAAASTNGCPMEKESCGSIDMIQNYMDYTSDICMNLFTEDQKSRIRTVMENSPRRNSLLTSPGLITPIVADNDMGIREIISPQPFECITTITPALELTNFGEKEVTSYKVRLFLQGNFIEEAVDNVQLETGENTTLSFSPLSVTSFGSSYEVSFEVSEVNGEEDGNDSNNSQAVNFVIPELGTLPLYEDFEIEDQSQLLTEGSIENSDNNLTWELTNAPGNGNDNQALFINFFEYDLGLGERDILYTPNYDFSNVVEATLVFKVAHALYSENGNDSESNDRLTIGASTDCGNNYSALIYNKAGKALATAPSTNSAFVPSNRTEWREEQISLNDFAGEPSVRLAFIGQNDYGNNLYIDDIELRVVFQTNNDISIARIISPAVLSCNTSPTPQILVKNTGGNVVNNFVLNFSVDDGTEFSGIYDESPLQPGEERIILLDPLELSLGSHQLEVRLTLPNTTADQQPENNTQVLTFKVDNKKDIIPIVNRFRGPTLTDLSSEELSTSERAWQVINPDNSITWELAETEGNGADNYSALLSHYNYPPQGRSDMLVSPTLDFSQTTEASLFFKVSYAFYNEEYVDTLRVMVSTDCGITYQTVYEKYGQELSIIETTDEWFPEINSDWRKEYINLSEFAGEENVRVAFVAINGFGNNLFLDDFEFFVSDNPEPVSLEEDKFLIYPNPAEEFLNITFNLLEKEAVRVELFNMQGAIIWRHLYPNTLNQTYSINVSPHPTGIYGMRILSPSLNPVRRIMVK